MLGTVRRSAAVLGALSCSLLLIHGCESEPTPGDLPEQTAEVKYTLPPATRFISSKTEASVRRVSQEDATVVLDPGSTLASTVAVGDVLVFGITSQTPEGLLRRVTSRTQTAEGVALKTEEAGLEDAFQELDLHMERPVEYGQVSNFDTQLQGLTIRQRQDPLTIKGGTKLSFEIFFENTIIYDHDGNKSTTNDQVVADGSIGFSVGFHFEVKISWFKLKKLDVGASLNQDGKVVLRSTFTGPGFQKEVVAGKMKLTPFSVGPVVIRPELQLIVGASGELRAQIETSVSEHLGVGVGARFENGKWTPYATKSATWEFQPPTLSVSSEIRGYVGPRVVLKIYGVAGPSAQVVAFLEFAADTSQDPWWELYAGIEGGLGIEGSILGKQFLKWRIDRVVELKVPLADAGGPFSLCKPDCSGRPCGPDPVCQQSCGTCTPPATCNAAGQCTGGTCTPDCTGRQCGLDPVCGTSCGPCAAPKTCNAAGQCICTPNCTGRVCGPDPVCGTSCGPCAAGLICTAAGQCSATWKDTVSGLTWEVTPHTNINAGYGEYTCSTLVKEGSGWRMPDIDELRTLIRSCSATQTGGACPATKSCVSGCLNPSCAGCTAGAGPAAGCYWPAEMQGPCETYSAAYVPGGMYGVNFSTAGVLNVSSGYITLRCVR